MSGSGAVSGVSFATIVAGIVDIVNTGVIPLLYAFAFIAFLIGVLRYFFFGDGEESREKGKVFIVSGIIGFVVIFSVWGIVHFFLSVLPGAGV